MGDLFDRNVHPLYAVMAFVSGLIVLLLLISGMRKRKEMQRNHKIIFMWVIFFCLQDGVWGLFASHIFRSDTGLFLMSVVFHLSAALSAFGWTVYFLSRIKTAINHRRIYSGISVALLVVQLGLIIANFFDHFMFFVDQDGWYQTTDYRAILFYLQFAVYIIIGIVSFIGTAGERGETGDSLLTIFFVNLSPLFFSVFQLIYPDAPADSIGFAIACVIIELFLSRDYKEQVYTLEQVQQKLEETVAVQTEQLRRQNRELISRAEQLRESKLKVIDILGSVVEDRSLESGMHIRRVKEYTRILAESVMEHYPEYGLTEELIHIMTSVSALHDVGKITIPDSILLKPGRLTDEEFEIMKTHAVRGCEVLDHLEGIWEDNYEQMCYDICRYHHERCDGRGYPEGLKGDDIPISAQIVSVADVYDALVSERCYKKPYPPDKAYDMIRGGECGCFNPKIMRCFEMTRHLFEQVSAGTPRYIL